MGSAYVGWVVHCVANEIDYCFAKIGECIMKLVVFRPEGAEDLAQGKATVSIDTEPPPWVACTQTI